jgi:hypothetical protein
MQTYSIEKEERSFVVIDVTRKGRVYVTSDDDLRLSLDGFLCIEDSDGDRYPVLLVNESSNNEN